MNLVMRLRFLSSHQYKIIEVRAILEALGIEVVPVSVQIDEIQTDDLDALVRDKCIKAYRQIGRPLFVEHTGLKIDALNGFPGGLTRIFWESLEADRFAELFGNGPMTGVTAHTQIGYCDGCKVHHFPGELKGTIPPTPRGSRDFQWDCVFVPEGYEET